jgi:Flp pilus assembly protein TadG
MKAALPRAIFASQSGAAAMEMALVAPILLTLMFGALELGNYFLSEHVVVKAVRDGARYASRRAITEYSCPSTVSNDVITKTRNLTRTGVVTGGTARLVNWTEATTITVSLSCTAIAGGNYSGIYNGMTSLPHVRVLAVVPYTSLFQMLGFTSSSLSLRADSEATVMGL